MSLPLLAGTVSTVIFVLSTLPMLVKAAKSKDLSSYSRGNILLSNAGNVVHSVYVLHLPAGPLWLLHSFYLVSTGLMLVWYLRYTPTGQRSSTRRHFMNRAYTELPTLPATANLHIPSDAMTPTDS